MARPKLAAQLGHNLGRATQTLPTQGGSSSPLQGHGSWLICEVALRARDHYTSSILIGRKGGAGPSSLHTTLEGPTEYVNARWM